ncbi:hypothetical protein D3C81_2340010 [compost metagenome]
MERPTVPNAEVVSNKMLRKLASSVVESTIATAMTRNKASIVIVTALKIRS